MKNIILLFTSILIMVVYSVQNDNILDDGIKWGLILYIFILLCDWLFISYFTKEFRPIKNFINAKVFIYKDDGLNWLSLFSWVIIPLILILGVLVNEKTRSEISFELLGVCILIIIALRGLFRWFVIGKPKKSNK